MYDLWFHFVGHNTSRIISKDANVMLAGPIVYNYNVTKKNKKKSEAILGEMAWCCRNHLVGR